MFVLRVSSQIHDALFAGANRKFRQIPWNKINRERHNKDRDAAQQTKRAKRLVRKVLHTSFATLLTLPALLALVPDV
jgi:hypothetical protein